MWFIGVEEVEQETSAPPPKKNPGSTPGYVSSILCLHFFITYQAGSWELKFNLN